VEIRPCTGGTGITFSLKEEDYRGEGSLFRIENLSPFPLWIAQNGLLANPGYFDLSPILSSSENGGSVGASHGQIISEKILDSGINGDLVQPTERIAFGLDAPFLQGKHGRVIPSDLLLLVRVALAPLSTRDGVESTKVIGLTSVGSTIRLGPSKLRNNLDENTITQLLGVRVLGVVCSDGPTRVLRFW